MVYNFDMYVRSMYLRIPGNSLRIDEKRRTALSASSALPRHRCEKAEFASSLTAHTEREMLGEAVWCPCPCP